MQLVSSCCPGLPSCPPPYSLRMPAHVATSCADHVAGGRRRMWYQSYTSWLRGGMCGGSCLGHPAPALPCPMHREHYLLPPSLGHPPATFPPGLHSLLGSPACYISPWTALFAEVTRLLHFPLDCTPWVTRLLLPLPCHAMASCVTPCSP